MGLTKEQVNESARNHRRARKHFGILDKVNMGADTPVLHHIDKTLKERDIERYIQWNPEDLVVVTKAEHIKIHAVDKIGKPHKGGYHYSLSSETKKRMSKPRSEEHKKHISEASKGRPCPTRGMHRVYRDDGTFYMTF